MPPAAGVVAQSDRVPMGQMVMPATATAVQSPPAIVSEAFAKDAIIAWFRGEFAAANAIIDALCNHLTQLEGGAGPGSEYESVFAAIHRRRLNWIPILQMQKYYSIADVALELRTVAAKKVQEKEDGLQDIKTNGDLKSDPCLEKIQSPESLAEESVESAENGGGEAVDEDSTRDESPESEITDTGSQEVQAHIENIEIFSNDEDIEARRVQIKITKGFVAKEPVKGHMVNVVKGLKLFEDVFTEIELAKLSELVHELRIAGQNGELSGDTFILYNQQMKGNKREMIQLGMPIFGCIKEDPESETRHIEPIPLALQGVIDRLIHLRLISENRRPNGCIINFFDEGEFSQPFLKPPHLDQPLCTILLSESTMAFGRSLVSDSDGNYRGPLMLVLKEGSILVMRGNSADMARHVMCSSPNKRASITFFRIRADDQNNFSTAAPATGAMTLWQSGGQTPYGPANGMLEGYNGVPKWGIIRAPLVMVAPMRPMVLSPRKIPRGGTGVFLPWTVGSRRHAKHLPPRAQKGRFLALPPPVEAQKVESSNPSINLDSSVH